MNPSLAFCLAALLLLPLAAHAQGTFIYDQQSSVEGVYSASSFVDVERTQTAQSFTPALDAVGFIRIVLYDTTPNNTSPGLLYINLRSGSPTGPLLASTEPVTVPAGTQGARRQRSPSPTPSR